MIKLLERVAKDWPDSAPKPVVLVGTEFGVDRFTNFSA
jgi:hypothetical protein